MTLVVPLLALALMLPCSALATGSETPVSRAVVPIRMVKLPGGGRFFALPLAVGTTTMLVAIDTGSAGLRVLRRKLSAGDAMPTGQPASLTFESGTTIAGARASAVVTFGTLRGTAPIELIDRVSCIASRPRCAEGNLPIEQFGLMGGGKPNLGAPAIIGLSRSDIPVTVPFPALGVRRWIVDIPNDIQDGQLVLDPAADELSGFVSFPPPIGSNGKPIGGIDGCLRNDRSGETLCGVIVFDTGAAGISVSSPDALPTAWPPHTPASLLYRDATGRTRLAQRFATGDRAHSSRLRFDDHPSGTMTVIHANASPYFCFDVMYEAPHGPISLRPRASGPRDPHAYTVP